MRNERNRAIKILFQVFVMNSIFEKSENDNVEIKEISLLSTLVCSVFFPVNINFVMFVAHFACFE